MWGLRADETSGAHLISLDIGLPVSDLRSPIREILSGKEEQAQLMMAATNRRGKPVQCRISLSPLRHADRSIAGAILLLDEVSAASQV